MATNNSINTGKPIEVSNGGTGVATLTAHGVLLGEGTGNITPTAVGTNGQVFIGASAADPGWVTPTVGTGLSLTTNATTLSYGLTIPVVVSSGGTGATTLTNHGVLLGQTTAAVVATTAGTNGQVLVGGTGDPAFATLTSADSSIVFTTGNNTLALSVAGGGTTWVDQTGASVTMAVNTGYVADRGTLVTLTLPTTAAFGTILKVAGYGAGGWLIAQNANQIIHFGSKDTTTGAGGSLASSVRYDQVDLLCTVANLEWVVRASMGNITIV